MEEVKITVAMSNCLELGMVLDLSNTTSVKGGQYVITGWVDSNTVTLVALTGWRLLWHRFKGFLSRFKSLLTRRMWWKVQDAYWDAKNWVLRKLGRYGE